ncbi:uncharacterized protein LOC116845109 [Odontomachus brunneus]|uniref:uncharacterized protein LOC116845109 n=1 Tax=Odontomachus brunneus TaxID=486640 RepID=UPI0013F1B56C|nr:uncharacterized protein LOC116845109 [Odontomachus brunneus]
MNVILIPFFLAANVVVNDTSEWIYGPECLYNVNVTTVIKSDSPTSVFNIKNIQLISAMKCQPKAAENTLLCILQNSTEIMSRHEDNTTREIKTEQIFEIKFNEQGVESVLIESPSNWQSVDIIRKIAKQLSVDADMNRKIGVSQFMVPEVTSFGNSVMTMYKITREELPETLETLDVTKGVDFQLVVLPMADGRPRTTLTIEKSRMGNIILPRSFFGFTGTVKMGRSYSKIYVDGLSGFETYEMKDAELRVPVWKSIVSRIMAFNVLLSLDSIVPAQDPPPFISNGKLIDLNLDTDIPSNID